MPAMSDCINVGISSFHRIIIADFGTKPINLNPVKPNPPNQTNQNPANLKSKQALLPLLVYWRLSSPLEFISTGNAASDNKSRTFCCSDMTVTGS